MDFIKNAVNKYTSTSLILRIVIGLIVGAILGNAVVEYKTTLTMAVTSLSTVSNTSLLVAVVLGVCSYFWYRDADPEPDARSPWIGIALLPVMLTGAAVGIAAFAAVTF